jgi:hypothetical protein
MLLQTCGCTLEEAIVVCEKLIDLLKHRLKQEEKNTEVLSQTKDGSVEPKGYKITRFKKPLPPEEERKIYQRVCRRCDEIYKTFHKHSWFCDKCKLGNASNETSKK